MFNVLLNKVSIARSNSERIILKDIAFGLSGGNIYIILGKNGTGKSTLLKSLTGLLDRRFYSVNGKVIYNQNDILSIDSEKLRGIRKNEIKYIFQDALNSFDHLKTFGYYFNNYREKLKGNEVDELLEFFLLPDSSQLFRLYPYEVSGGMAQRISLVLALLSKPKILFLDEPTSGIDAPIINIILIKLKDFVKEGNIVLLVTQDIELARSSGDKIALLSDGTLSKFCTPEEFFILYPMESEV